MLLFSKGKSDYNLGRNENLNKEEMGLLISEMKKNIQKGTLENIQINKFNLIRHFLTTESINTTMYYMYDYDDILFYLFSSVGSNNEWKRVEDEILQSIERKNQELVYPKPLRI